MTTHLFRSQKNRIRVSLHNVHVVATQSSMWLALNGTKGHGGQGSVFTLLTFKDARGGGVSVRSLMVSTSET